MRLLCCTLPALVLMAGARAATPVVRDGQLLRDGKPYRAIGVNYFNAFLRTLAKPEGDTSYDAGFAALAQKGIPFARMAGCGFWPVDWKLYLEHRDDYFQRFDGVVKSAEAHRIGLIPSLFWNLATPPDLAGEPCDQWGNPDSKTIALMRRYVADVVGRYKDSPAIWAWEFGNEYNLAADLPNAKEHRPPVWPNLGTAKSRSEHDEMTHAQIRSACAEFAKAVRLIDPVRPITSGNSMPRPSAWHQIHEHGWTKDNAGQLGEVLADDHPAPLDLSCVHAYGDDGDRLLWCQAAAGAMRKPLFVGEFGVEGPGNEVNRGKFGRLLAAVEASGAPLAALWVYDYGNQDEWTVTATNARSWQLDLIAAANARLK